MKNVLIDFEKSLIIPNQDYEIFKKENYYIDDGTMHIFERERNVLIVLDNNNELIYSVCFRPMKLENKNCFEIIRILYGKLKSEIDPVNDIEGARKQVLDIIIEVFISLDEIIKKRTKDLSNNELFYTYITYDKNNRMYDKTTSRIRTSYLQFFQELRYVFAVFDE